MSHLVLYDGVCGLCDRFVHFLLKRDSRDQLRFAALQGATGREMLARHGRRDAALSTVVVIKDRDTPDEQLLDRSDAALFVIGSLGGVWSLASALRIVPRVVRNAIYNLIAKWRYRIFGQFDACPVPTKAARRKFLD